MVGFFWVPGMAHGVPHAGPSSFSPCCAVPFLRATVPAQLARPIWPAILGVWFFSIGTDMASSPHKSQADSIPQQLGMVNQKGVER